MGGKKLQRTKGNTRPSSSGRTALLLTENVTNNAFIGFSVFKETDFEQSTSDQKNEEFDLSNDADICLVFKKMQKKDNITKMKAVLEFSDLCETKDEGLIKALLPFWPKFYNKLALDLDWKVREAVHKAMQRLVARVKKDIAPILKQVMPVWLISFFDPYPPAASSAIASFNDSFGNEKQKDIFTFCKNELLSFCRENLLKIELEVVSESEVDKKEFIMLNSSMKALSLLLVKLDNDFCEPFIKSFLECEKFWKFSHHKIPEIRCSWFKLKTTICQVFPDVVKCYRIKFCRTTLNCITDSDPNTCSAVWENCSVIIPIIDDWWKHVNFLNSFRKQLFCAMRKKSYSFIFAHLPLILNHTPREACIGDNQFINEFFDVFNAALRNTENVTWEYRDIVISYFDCLKCLVTTSKIVTSEEKSVIFREILNNQLKPTMQRYIKEYGSKKRNALFYEQLSKFCESLNGFYELSLVLNCVEDICVKTAESCVNNSESLCGIVQFIHDSSFISEKSASSSSRRIQFQLNDKTECLIADQKRREKVTKVFEKVIVSIADQIINTIESGSFDFNWLLLLREISTCSSLSALDRHKLELIKNFLLKFVAQQSQNLNVAENSQIIEFSITLLFKIYEIIDSKEELFLNLVGFSNPFVLEKVVENILRLTEHSFVEKWKKSDAAVSLVLRVTKELISRININDDKKKLEWKPLWNSLISLCTLEELREACLNDVILLFQEVIRENNLHPSNDMLDFVCDVSENIFFLYKNCDALPSFHSLILTFYKLSCEISNKRERLISVWTKGLELICDKSESNSKNVDLLKQFAIEFHRQLNGCISTPAKASILTNNVVMFLQIVKKNSKEEASLFELLFQSILLSFEEWSILSSQLKDSLMFTMYFSDCLIPQVIHVKIEDVVPPVIFTSLVTVDVLNAFIPNITKNDTYLFNQLFACVSFTYCKVMSSFLSHNSKAMIHEIYDLVKDGFQKLLSNYSGYVESEVIPQLYQLSISKDSIFGVTLKHILEQFSMKNLPKCCSSLTNEFTQDTFATLQILASRLDESEIHEHFLKALYQLLSLEPMNILTDGLTFLALINSLISTNVTFSFEEHINPLLDFFVGLKDHNSDIYSYKKENEYFQFAAILVGLYEVIITRWNNKVTPEHKDLIFCSTTSWIINMCEDNENLVGNTPFTVLLYRVMQLVKTICSVCGTSESSEYSEEWIEFHSTKIFLSLLPLFCNFHSECSPVMHHLECALSEAVSISASSKVSFVGILPDKTISQELFGSLKKVSVSIPAEENLLLNNLCPIMTNHKRPLYLTAHTLIMKILSDVAPNIKVETSGTDEYYLFPPYPILCVLHETDEVVETMLSEYRVGDCYCVVDTSTDFYHCTLSYLLSWMQVLHYFNHLNSENRSLLSGFLTESRLFFKLMNNLFRLMPVSDTGDGAIENLFLEQLHLDIYSSPTSRELQHVACQLFKMCLKTMPASVRLWVGSQDKRTVDTINTYTIAYLSHHMAAEEFRSIQNTDLSFFKNMTIKARPSAREIFTVYSVEDMSIELTIKFPTNHPITAVTIDCGKRVGVSFSQWRTWLLQLTTFLTHQNGSIVDGLFLWKKNIDKRFEGIEECMICFYILHGSTCQLPKLSCRHCKKKYHSACLFKWFKTSNNATCPLCRNLFDTKI